MAIIELKEIDKLQSDVSQSLNSYLAACSNFKESKEFVLGDLSAIEKFLINFDNKKGVYFFIIKNENESFEKDSCSFKDIWAEHRSNFKETPEFYVNRLSTNNTSKKKWIVLYVGKSQNLKKRIYEEHIKGNSTTYGLRLLQSEKLFTSYKFKILLLELDVVNYDSICMLAEKYYKDKYQPVIGK
jgi:hypothetical protein